MLDAHIAAKRLPSGEMLLRDIHLMVRPGEVVAILGSSGIGKTSTLRILLGLDRDFEGTVTRTALRVGALFQEPRLLRWKSVADNIRLVVPRGQPMPDIEALLHDVGLPGTGALYPGQLSLGMARRAALARALAITPDLLVLDEPFASLDPGSAVPVAACLVRMRDERRTALVIAMHDMELATALATRVVVLAGRPATVAYQSEPGVAPAAIRADLAERFTLVSDVTPPDGGGGLSGPAAAG